MAMTKEQLAALEAECLSILMDDLPKPKAVTVEGEIIRDADVVVSATDANAAAGDPTECKVRKSDPGWMTLKEIGVDRLGYWTVGPDGRPRYVQVKEYREWSSEADCYVETDGPDGVVSGYNPFSNERIWGR
jgi:hypothetical protein